MKLSERRELSVTLATLTRCPGEEEASHLLDGRNQTGPKIWLIVGAVSCCGRPAGRPLWRRGRIRNRRNRRLLNRGDRRKTAAGRVGVRTGRSLAFSWSRGSSRLCAAPKRKTDATLAEWRTWSYVPIPARARATSDMSEHPPRRATVLGRGTSTAAIAATSRNDAPRRPRIADISGVRSDVVPRDHGGTSSRR